MTEIAAKISADDAEEYSQSLAQIGQGWWRQIAWAFRQGMHEALDMSRREWAERYHGYIKLDPDTERKPAVLELREQGLNNSEIADTLGVDEKTVRNDLKPDSDYSESPGEGLPNPEPAERPDSDYSEPDVDAQPVENPVEPEQQPVPSPVVNDGDEWYTPRWLFDALGVKFEIDVCAPLNTMYSSVPALRGFTIEDDGLSQSWEGTVWCNPPYSKPEPWARRMIHHRDGLLLTHIPMNAGWCVDLWETCDAIRLFQAMEFVRPDGTSQRPGYWLQLAAFGETATQALARLQPLGSAASNKRRIASPMWGRVA